MSSGDSNLASKQCLVTILLWIMELSHTFVNNIKDV